MAFELENFQDPELHADYLTFLVDRHWPDVHARFSRLWDYFRNPLVPIAGPFASAFNANSRPYVQAQEVGLPPRITGVRRSPAGAELTDVHRKEVVIENDIAWRVQTMIDFLFGRTIVIRSLAPDTEKARRIEQVIEAMMAANGGVAFLQEMAIFGAVYGFVDVALRIPAERSAGWFSRLSHPAGLPATPSPSAQVAGRPGPSDKTSGAAEDKDSSENGQTDRRSERSGTLHIRAMTMAENVQLETIEAPRVLPILDENDYRRVRYWVQKYYKRPAQLSVRKRSRLSWGRNSTDGATPALVEVVEILGLSWWQRYEDRHLVAEGANALGHVPVVHIQNLPIPGSYEGASDVEQLIPLQDELNTRLSDRANRVTYQSFKMYLGKGIDDFLERPVGPGQMWSTQNPDASIQEFGSDVGSPSEDIHIDEVRQAMDKVSAVTPLAAGLIRGTVGNLTSAAALKVVLAGMLARTQKKRLTFGAGLQQIVSLALAWMDHLGVLRTAPQERRVEIHWSNPLPTDEGEQLRNAQIKLQLGVPNERILAELGYASERTSASPQ